MKRLPLISGEEVVKALTKAGFLVVRQRGSHLYLRHPDGRGTVVPMHKGEELGRGLLRGILREAKLAREEFLKFLL